METRKIAIIFFGALPLTMANESRISEYTNKGVLADQIQTISNNELLRPDYRYSESGNTKNTVKSTLIEKIAAFRNLENDWDGYKAIPLLDKVYHNALSLLGSVGDHAIQNVDDFFPNPNGTLSIVWKNAKSERVSVEIGNITFSYYYKSNAGNPQFFNSNHFEPDNISSLRGVIEQLI